MMLTPDFAEFEARYVEGFYTTRYIEAGPRDGEKVLLLHDGTFGTDAELCWGGVIGALSSAYHVFAPELLGWGGTSKIIDFAASRYDLQQAHIDRFCAEVGIIDDPISLVGTSFGGSLVVRAVCSGTSSELKLRKAVSISGTGGPFRRLPALQELGDYTPTREEAHRITRLIMSPAEPDDTHVDRRYRNSLIPGHWEALQALQLRNPSGEAQREEWAKHTGERPVKGSRFPDSFATATVPILLVEGTRDMIVEPRWSEELARRTSMAATHKIAAGHSPNLDQPQQVADIIMEFIE